MKYIQVAHVAHEIQQVVVVVYSYIRILVYMYDP